MSLILMYITNNPEVAWIAQRAGVDRIWVDLESIGKEERQAGLNTVKSNHCFGDIEKIKPMLTTSELLVRVNPIHEPGPNRVGSKEEIDTVIRAGADVVMLPYFKTCREVERFIQYIDGRAKTLLLLETREADRAVWDIISIPGIDEIHIGLNDLHLAYRKRFLFELLADGTVERLCEIFRQKGIQYGFGGIARVGHGKLPAEYIIAEHYRLGSSMAILSRDFCNANTEEDPKRIEHIFMEGIQNIRKREKEANAFSEEDHRANVQYINQKLQEILDRGSCQHNLKDMTKKKGTSDVA